MKNIIEDVPEAETVRRITEYRRVARSGESDTIGHLVDVALHQLLSYNGCARLCRIARTEEMLEEFENRVLTETLALKTYLEPKGYTVKTYHYDNDRGIIDHVTRIAYICVLL